MKRTWHCTAQTRMHRMRPLTVTLDMAVATIRLMRPKEAATSKLFTLDSCQSLAKSGGAGASSPVTTSSNSNSNRGTSTLANAEANASTNANSPPNKPLQTQSSTSTTAAAASEKINRDMNSSNQTKGLAALNRDRPNHYRGNSALYLPTQDFATQLASNTTHEEQQKNNASSAAAAKSGSPTPAAATAAAQSNVTTSTNNAEATNTTSTGKNMLSGAPPAVYVAFTNSAGRRAGRLYKKKLCFESTAERESFYFLVTALAFDRRGHAYRLFNSLDSDHDGIVSHTQLGKALAALKESNGGANHGNGDADDNCNSSGRTNANATAAAAVGAAAKTTGKTENDDVDSPTPSKQDVARDLICLDGKKNKKTKKPGKNTAADVTFDFERFVMIFAVMMARGDATLRAAYAESGPGLDRAADLDGGSSIAGPIKNLAAPKKSHRRTHTTGTGGSFYAEGIVTQERLARTLRSLVLLEQPLDDVIRRYLLLKATQTMGGTTVASAAASGGAGIGSADGASGAAMNGGGDDGTRGGGIAVTRSQTTLGSGMYPALSLLDKDVNVSAMARGGGHRFLQHHHSSAAASSIASTGGSGEHKARTRGRVGLSVAAGGASAGPGEAHSSSPRKGDMLGVGSEPLKSGMHPALKSRGGDGAPALPLLKGEVLITSSDFASQIEGSMSSRGSLFLTNFRVTFEDYRSGSLRNVTLGNMNRVERNDKMIAIFTKDFQRLTYMFMSAEVGWVTSLYQQMVSLAFPGDQKRVFATTFATSYKYDGDDREEVGWQLYSINDEYRRIGLLEKGLGFRMCTANDRYKLSPTYPRRFVVPTSLNDEDLSNAASFRSRARLPVVIWLHPLTHASLARCSQPMAGLLGKRCPEDEALVQQLRELNPTNSNLLYVVDARPRAAALGNAIKGKGVEKRDAYARTKLIFLGIENIHAQRGALHKLAELCSTPTVGLDEASWNTRLADCKWLSAVRTILEGALRIARMLTEEGTSVLLHCSDGWDRTAQLSSLALLMLDRYHRTRRGFAVLVEKEWCSFGHQFAKRIGHADANYGHDQRAPIFLQFLDCVYQLLRQYPLSFEFNEEYLIALLDAVYSCQFGNFLFNNDRERHIACVKKETHSVWNSLVSMRTASLYVNPLYRPFSEMILAPHTSPKRIILWEGLHLRHERSNRFVEVEMRDLAVAELFYRYHRLRRAVAERDDLDLEEMDPGGDLPWLQAHEEREALQEQLDAEGMTSTDLSATESESEAESRSPRSSRRNKAKKVAVTRRKKAKTQGARQSKSSPSLSPTIHSHQKTMEHLADLLPPDSPSLLLSSRMSSRFSRMLVPSSHGGGGLLDYGDDDTTGGNQGKKKKGTQRAKFRVGKGRKKQRLSKMLSAPLSSPQVKPGALKRRMLRLRSTEWDNDDSSRPPSPREKSKLEKEGSSTQRSGAVDGVKSVFYGVGVVSQGFSEKGTNDRVVSARRRYSSLDAGKPPNM